MTLTGVRLGILTAGAMFVALAASPASAQQPDCPDPGSLAGVSGRAGDQVTLGVPAGCDGASFSVTLDGGSAGGTVAGSSASFAMPDLGPGARSTTGSITVSPPEGDGWTASFPVDYSGGADSTDPPSEPSPRHDPAPAPTPHAAAPTAVPIGAQRQLAPSRGEVKGVTRHGVRKLLRGAGQLVRSVLSGRPPHTSKRAAHRARHRAQRARDRAERYLSELPPQVRKHPPEGKRDQGGLPDHLPGAKFSVPWRGPLALFVLGLLVVLTLSTLAGQRERRARRERAVEAELQEIVAEERAREPEPA